MKGVVGGGDFIRPDGAEVFSREGRQGELEPCLGGALAILGLAVIGENNLKKAGKVSGNLARFFQVILTDDGKAKDGQSAPKARFQFPLAALSGKNFSSIRADKIAASYYTFQEGDPSKETPIPMERFNFGAVTSVTYQGEFGGTDMRLEVRKVEAVR